MEVALKLIEKFGLLGEKDQHIEFVADRKINDRRYFICTSKMEKLGWHPQVTWEEGINKTSEFL